MRRGLHPCIAGQFLYIRATSAGPVWGLNGGPRLGFPSLESEPSEKGRTLPPPVSPLSTVSIMRLSPASSGSGEVAEALAVGPAQE
jgi:hypothetical protein